MGGKGHLSPPNLRVGGRAPLIWMTHQPLSRNASVKIEEFAPDSVNDVMYFSTNYLRCYKQQCYIWRMFLAVHNFIHLFLTVPISSSTSDRSFSALKQLYTYLCSSMTKSHLNNCLLLHIHKDYTNNLDLLLVAKEFVKRNDEKVKHFGQF